MPERPICLNKRCKVLDELVEDINTKADKTCDTPATEKSSSENQVGIKLMCDFWKILQEDPECNLSHEVQRRLCVANCTGRCRRDQSGGGGGGGGPPCGGKSSCSKITRIQSSKSDSRKDKPVPKKHNCGATSDDTIPLHKALGNLKEAASFEKKCNAKAGELESAQRELTGKIIMLECKEKKGTELLKQADCMWSCMEEEYKQKLAACQEKYQFLQNNLQQIEASGDKWRKTKKDLEFSLKNAVRDHEVITQRINQKTNDVKVMSLEIEEFQNRIASNTKELEAIQNSYTTKKEASDAKLAKIAEELAQYQNKIVAECKCKDSKEKEGGEYVKDAREDLQKLCRCLLQKKLENEDLRAEKEALLLEIGLLKTTCDTCTERCAKREKNIAEETKRMDKEIDDYISKCKQCHRSTDSSDIKNFCTDCPKCLKERECLIKGDHCDPDHSQDCVCTRIKEKFLDNVFDNMYSVLDKESKTCTGRELADCIMNCLKRSRNGKLDEETRKILQDFILSTVKKNLNLTIVGGAVKTRCEMEPDTYNQLMLCLKDVTIKPPPKADKSVARKPPCSRWSETSECYCPGGPKSCPCSKRAPSPPSRGPIPCGQSHKVQTGPEQDRSVSVCPKQESLACGTDCGMLGFPGAKNMRRQPCEGKSCPFDNMRAAQCSLGPDALPYSQPVGPCGRFGCSCDTCASGYSSTPRASNSGSKRVTLCNTDTKHLKANLKDKESARTNYKKKNKQKRPYTCLPLSGAAPKHSILTSGSSRHKDNLLDGHAQKTIHEELDKHSHNQDETKEQFMLAIENGQRNCQFTKLTHTGSGNLAIELDDHTIKILEEKTTTNPYFAMSIKTTISGYVLVDLDKNEDVIDKTQRVTVRRTASGTTLLDVHKNMIKALKDTISFEKSNSGLYKSIKLPSSPKSLENPTSKQLLPIDFKKTKNDEDDTGNSSLKLQFMETTDVDYKSISSKITVDSDGCQSISPGSTGTKYFDPDVPLKDVTKPKNTDNYLKDVLGPIVTELYKPLINEINKEFKFTSPETATNSDGCKLTSSIDFSLKDIIESTIVDKKSLLENEKPSCSGVKTNTNEVSCKRVTELDSPQDWLTISSWKSCTFKSVDNCNCRSELKKLYKEGNVNVIVEIQVKNGVVRKLSSVVTKTKSGTLAIYAKGMSSLKEISCDEKEYPVLLSKTVSGTYFVSISNNDNSNASLKQTPSEGILLIPKKRERHEVKDFFKVKLSIMRNQALELPAVLRTTSSDNYIVVLDKEFEIHYKEIINKYFGDELEGSVDLHTTSSGNFVIELGHENENPVVEKNALLVKSSSGNIKVIVQRPEFESMVQLESTSNSSLSAQASTPIDSNLPTTSGVHKEDLEKSKTVNTSNASSNTRLFEKVKVTLQDSGQLNDESCAVLKKSKSGLYAVVLNKESKKAFLDNLQGTLTPNSEVVVPVKRLDSGEIIIDLNNKDNIENGLYGSLRITPSENLFVVIDEDVIKDLAESSIKSVNLSNTRSKHVTQLIDSVARAIPTTSCVRSDNCSCNASMCVCNELRFDTMDGSNCKLTERTSPCAWKEASAENCNTEKCGSPSEPGTSIQESFISTEQCYYLLTSSPQFSFKGSMSDELEVKELYKEHEKRPNKIKTVAADSEQCAEQNIKKPESYLNFLEPQLPAFLIDVVHRYRH